MSNGPLLGLKILKVRQAFEVGSQVLRVERPLEAGPAKRLRLIDPPEGLKNRNPGLLPFKGDPTRSILFDGIDGSPSLLGAACSQEPASDLHSHTQDVARLLILLGN